MLLCKKRSSKPRTWEKVMNNFIYFSKLLTFPRIYQLSNSFVVAVNDIIESKTNAECSGMTKALHV